MEVAAGQTRHVSVPLDARAFAWYNPQIHNWTIDPGRFIVSVGDSITSLPLTSTLEIGPDMAKSVPLER